MTDFNVNKGFNEEDEEEFTFFSCNKASSVDVENMVNDGINHLSRLSNGEVSDNFSEIQPDGTVPTAMEENNNYEEDFDYDGFNQETMSQNELIEIAEYGIEHMEGLSTGNVIDNFTDNEGEKSPSLPTRSRSKKQATRAENVGVYTPHSLAQVLMKKRKFLLIDKAVYVYNGLVYTLLDDQELDRLIYQELRSAIETEGKPGIITEIRKFIKLGETVESIPVDSDHIVFRNGRYNLLRDTFEENDSDIFATSYLDFEYDEDNKFCPNFKAYLNSITGGNESLKKLILEVMGYLLSCSNKAKKFFVIFGPGNSGKSLFLNLLRSFYPSQFVSSIELQDLGGKFSSGNLVDKRINIGGDLPNKKLTPDVIKTVKGLTGNDLMTAERKYQQPFSYQPTCRLVFATNHNITLAYKDEQFLERLIILPFMNPISPEEQDRELLEKLKQELPAIFNKALKAFKRLQDNNFVFTEVENGCKFVNILSDGNGKGFVMEEAVTRFVNERCTITGSKDDFEFVGNLYAAFSRYYQEVYNLSVEMDEFAKTFKAAVRELDVEYKQKNRGRGYIGLYIDDIDNSV